MTSKKRRNSDDSLSEEGEEAQTKKQRADKDASDTTSGTADAKLHILETGNDTIVLEWTTPNLTKETSYSIILKRAGFDDESQAQSITTSESLKAHRIEFADLKPLCEYTVTVSDTEENHSQTSLYTMTRPSLEMPEIEGVQEGCAHLTLAPLPEDEAKDVVGYLLLVRPLEDAEDYPEDGIKSQLIKAELAEVVRPPFYIAYEFTQEQLSEEGGGQIKIGSGTEKKDGKYGTIQDPKLQSGAYYRVVLVVIISKDGKQKMYAEESCRMLIK